jgi:hypothetical protein
MLPPGTRFSKAQLSRDKTRRIATTMMGTGTTPTCLPGDDPVDPGFPAKAGQ